MAFAKTFSYNQNNSDKRNYPSWLRDTPRMYDQQFRPSKRLDLPRILFNYEPQEGRSAGTIEKDNDANPDFKLSIKFKRNLQTPVQR